MDIQDIVATYGVKNIRVFLPLQPCHSLADCGLPIAVTFSDEEYHIVECEIDESRYTVSDGYKITFSPVERADQKHLFAREHFYQSDFDSLRRSFPDEYRIYVLVDEDAKYQRVREDEFA